MIAYKATYNQKCRNITYKVGKTYTFEGKLEMCRRGFHFCKETKDVLRYYDCNKDFVLLEIEVLGRTNAVMDKSVTDKFKVLRIVPKEEYNTLFDNCEFNKRYNCVLSRMLENGTIYYKYDQQGNLIRIESSELRYKAYYEYDKNNNLVYMKNFTKDEKHEAWHKYDKKNNLVYRGSSTGFEEFLTYDENDNLTHIKNYNRTGTCGYEASYEYEDNYIKYVDSEKECCSIKIE